MSDNSLVQKKHIQSLANNVSTNAAKGPGIVFSETSGVLGATKNGSPLVFPGGSGSGTGAGVAQATYQRTISASGWDSTTKIYSAFETEFPSSSYNIMVSLNDSASSAQTSAYVNANIIGSHNNNNLIALGTTPSIDIPVTVVVYYDGSGHAIKNSSGTTVTKRDFLQFGDGFSVSDDSANNKTIITPNINTLAMQDELGQIELGDTALYTHAVGETFIWKGQFVKCLSAISIGSAFTLNTNIQVTTVSAMLTEFNSKIPGFNSEVLNAEPDVSTSADTWVYTGVSFTATRGALYCISVYWTHNRPTGIGIARGSDLSIPTLYIDAGAESVSNLSLLACAISTTTYYIYGKTSSPKFHSSIYVYRLT